MQTSNKITKKRKLNSGEVEEIKPIEEPIVNYGVSLEEAHKMLLAFGINTRDTKAKLQVRLNLHNIARKKALYDGLEVFPNRPVLNGGFNAFLEHYSIIKDNFYPYAWDSFEAGVELEYYEAIKDFEASTFNSFLWARSRSDNDSPFKRDPLILCFAKTICNLIIVMDLPKSVQTLEQFVAHVASKWTDYLLIHFPDYIGIKFQQTYPSMDVFFNSFLYFWSNDEVNDRELISRLCKNIKDELEKKNNFFLTKLLE